MDKRIVDPRWTRTRNGWVTEASDLGDDRAGPDGKPLGPCVNVDRTADGEIAGWWFRDGILVIND